MLNLLKRLFNPLNLCCLCGKRKIVFKYHTHDAKGLCGYCSTRVYQAMEDIRVSKKRKYRGATCTLNK